MTNVVQYNAATGAWVPFEDTSTELGYAERTTNDTTTNTTYASAPSNKISGLSVTVVGEGLPVLVEFFGPGVYHGTANIAVNGVLIINGSVTSGQLATAASSSTSSARMSSLLRRRLVLTAGASYTFEIGKFISSAGTGTYTANADYPMHLVVTR